MSDSAFFWCCWWAAIDSMLGTISIREAISSAYSKQREKYSLAPSFRMKARSSRANSTCPIKSNKSRLCLFIFLVKQWSDNCCLNNAKLKCCNTCKLYRCCSFLFSVAITPSWIFLEVIFGYFMRSYLKSLNDLQICFKKLKVFYEGFVLNE